MSDYRSPVRILLDDSLDLVLLLGRVLAVAAALVALVAVFQFIWTSDGRWVATACVLVVVSAALGWLSWWYFGNEEWRRTRTVEAGTETHQVPARSGGRS